MFDGLKRLWGRIVSMFIYTTLKYIIGKDVALSQTMIDAINKWKRMLAGNADWCGDIVESLKLEECLNGFVTALAFYNGSYMSGVEFTCEFNDSILADEESERQQDRQDVSMGVMSLLEYRMKWYNEDEETAKAKLPEQNQVME